MSFPCCDDNERYNMISEDIMYGRIVLCFRKRISNSKMYYLFAFREYYYEMFRDDVVMK